jgi:predicted dehydrogenase
MHFHVAQSIAALQRDIHVMCEVTAAVSLDEARWLVREAGRSRATYMMAENCNFMKTNVLVKAMVDAGLFGETYYAEGEYLHEVQRLFFTPEGRPTWRYYWQVGVNGATYPTHSLGPCLAWLGERAQRISCIGAGHRSAHEYAMENTVLLLCKTQSDKLIRIRQDIISQRPQARLNYTLQGTRGVYESARRNVEGNWVWLEERSRNPEEWFPLQDFEAEFLPGAWRNAPPEAIASGHDGSDYFEVAEFIDAVQGRRQPSIGIHEAMDMTLPGLMSQESIRREGEWLDVPDSRTWS